MTFLIVFGVVILAFILLAVVNRKRLSIPEVQPATTSVPLNPVANDKMVLVKGVGFQDGLRKATQHFLKIYRSQPYPILPQFVKINEEETVILFPYDLPFELFCFFVNYIDAPGHVSYEAKVVAWMTTGTTEDWIKEEVAHKRVMLYMPASDPEGDNVFLSTEDNIGYKIGFAGGNNIKRLSFTGVVYIAPPFTIEQLQNMPSEEIRRG